MYTLIASQHYHSQFKKLSADAKNEMLPILEHLTEEPFGYGNITGLEAVQEIVLSFGKMWYDVDSQNQFVILYHIEE